MGLDISVYRQAKLVRAARDDDDYDGDLARPYVNPDFPGRADGLTNGLYAYGESDGFRAGSYGGYNRWREELAKFAGYPPTRHEDFGGAVRMLCAAACWQGAIGPFSELINFSDAEGTIGPKTAAKLAKDFADHDERARAHQSELGEWFYEAYGKWRDAFRMAADGGFVQFH